MCASYTYHSLGESRNKTRRSSCHPDERIRIVFCIFALLNFGYCYALQHSCFLESARQLRSYFCLILGLLLQLLFQQAISISFANRSGVAKRSSCADMNQDQMNEWSKCHKKSSFLSSLQDSWLLLYHRAADSAMWPTLILVAAFPHGFQIRYEIHDG